MEHAGIHGNHENGKHEGPFKTDRINGNSYQSTFLPKQAEGEGVKSTPQAQSTLEATACPHAKHVSLTKPRMRPQGA